VPIEVSVRKAICYENAASLLKLPRE
jgi:hypothetical protein